APVGEREAAAVRAGAAIALDVAAGAPAVGELLPRRRAADGEVVRQLQVHRAAGLPQRLGPRLDVRDVGQADAVDLQVVRAPRGEQVRPRVDELLRARLGVVDADHAPAVV